MARSLWGTPGLTEAKERHTRNEESPVVDKLPVLPATSGSQLPGNGKQPFQLQMDQGEQAEGR